MNKTILIAEAGVNHNGSLETALKMVEAAAETGADYVKFQTFVTESLTTAECRAARYQTTNCEATSQFQMLKKLELRFEDFAELKRACIRNGIGFLSTPFDKKSIIEIASLKPDFMKVPSGEITNLPYLREMAKTGIPVIISTGMCNLADIENALIPFREAGYKDSDIILLHCTTQYPTPYEDVNLKAMKTLSQKFGLNVGYSDHTMGIEVPVAAAALGARVIEKHFTLSRLMKGPDHAASLEPEEFKRMVSSIRNVAKALGSPDKKVTDSESENIHIARRSIVAAVPIKKGEVFTEMNLTCKRPGDGVSPMLWDSLIGKCADKDYEADQKIEI